MEAASAMDFHALSRRELQALCKRNGVRANMTNVAMADALQGLTSVDGIDEIGTTLCAPTPSRSTMKSAAKAAAAAGEEQRHGSPLPRGRRVSVMSPAAMGMDDEEGEDELKRDVVKEIIKTPGVALRSTNRRARATPAPLPTPATLRRSTRTAARKAAAPVEAENLVAEASTVKRTTSRASARPKMMMDLDQEVEVAVAATKVQQEEPIAVASDVKCDDPEEEEEVTKVLDGDNEEEPEEGEEADSSDTTNVSALLSDKSCDDRKLEDVADVEEKEATGPQEGLVAEQEPMSVEKPAPLALVQNSPIFGILSKGEATGEDGEGVADWSLIINEMSDEVNPVAEDNTIAATEEAIKEDGSTVTCEIVHAPKQILPAAASDETGVEDELVEVKEGASDEMQQTKLVEDEDSEMSDEASEMDEESEMSDEVDEMSDEVNPVEDKEISVTEEAIKEDGFTVTCETVHSPKQILSAAAEDETSEEDDLAEGKEGASDEMQQTELMGDEAGEKSDDEEWTSDDDEASEEIDSTDESDDENGEASEERQCLEVGTDLNQEKELVQMLQETAIASEGESSEEASDDGSAEEATDDGSDEEASEDDSDEEASEYSSDEASEDCSAEDDDFSGDLPPEFDNIVALSDAKTESVPVLEDNQTALASATKSVVKSLDDAGITEVQEASSVEVSAEAMKKGDMTVDNIVKSLDEFTISEGNTEAVELQKQLKSEDLNGKSLRKLKALYKNALNTKEGKKQVGAEGGKRLPLAEVDDNTGVDC